MFEVKEIADDGTFNGIASVYGLEDLGGDIIEKGAFAKTIAENGSIPILWQHDQKEVIGQGDVKEWQNKILLAGKLDLEDPVAAKAYRKLKQKLIKGLSIGFTAVKSTWQEIEEEGRTKYIRRIQELKLWEVSVVTFPMLPAAQVTRVKSAEDIDERLKRIEDTVSSLAAKQVATPIPEPAQAKEPTKSAEPITDHSKLATLLQSISDLIPKE